MRVAPWQVEAHTELTSILREAVRSLSLTVQSFGFMYNWPHGADVTTRKA
jgi:hypothetical protein